MGWREMQFTYLCCKVVSWFGGGGVCRCPRRFLLFGSLISLYLFPPCPLTLHLISSDLLLCIQTLTSLVGCLFLGFLSLGLGGFFSSSPGSLSRSSWNFFSLIRIPNPKGITESRSFFFKKSPSRIVFFFEKTRFLGFFHP